MTLDTLLQRRDIWRGGRVSPPTGEGLTTGFTALDAALPGGGWPQGALTELLLSQEGIGELRLLMPALARLSHVDRWIAWIAPSRLPYAPALAAARVELSRVLVVHVNDRTQGLWAIEQALRHGRCGAVLAWPRQADMRTLRRLQLAAEAGQAWGFLFRTRDEANTPSPAALRLRLEPSPHGLAVQILKCRGLTPPSFTLPLVPSHEGRG